MDVGSCGYLPFDEVQPWGLDEMDLSGESQTEKRRSISQRYSLAICIHQDIAVITMALSKQSSKFEVVVICVLQFIAPVLEHSSLRNVWHSFKQYIEIA